MESKAITEESLKEYRSRIGVERVGRGRAWNEVATADGIWHYARGIGDDNPLWCDGEYASKSRYGCIIAPPCFTYACGRGGLVKEGLPGAHALWAGDDWDFFQPIVVNDAIIVSYKLFDLVERQGKFARRMIEEIREFIYRNQVGEVVARVRRHTYRYERGSEAKEKGKYTNITKYRYNPRELQAIEEDYVREERRGANPRYWEDVKIGDELTPVVKGPLTVTDMVAWEMGAGGSSFTLAHALAHAFWRQHPGGMVRDPETGIPDFPIKAHWDEKFAKEIGMPLPYDIGGQRISWLGHLMTNWISDEGFLAKLYVQLRSPNFMGDTTWCKGKVTNKYARDGNYWVDCELWADNQMGDRTVKGSATVALPSRAGGQVVLPLPMQE